MTDHGKLTDEEKALDKQLEELADKNNALKAQGEGIKDQRRILTLRIDELTKAREQARLRAGRPTTQIG